MTGAGGDKTELPTFKRLEEAANRGQIARSPEVQTLFVLGAALIALKFAGPNILQNVVPVFQDTFSQLHSLQINPDELPGQVAKGFALLASCLAPLLLTTASAGLLAGALQSRLRLASEALRADFNRLNPGEGFKRIWSRQALVNTAFALVKFAVVGAVSWNSVSTIFGDPIFHHSIGTEEIARFIVETSLRVGNVLMVCLLVFAGADYFYQFWTTFKSLMMTKEEVKEEFKNMEGDPQMKARMRRRKKPKSQRQMLAEVPQADVVVTNPTHIAIALRYDRKTMRAPIIIAKGIRLNATRIREIAEKHQVPIIENKPVARLMFRHGRVGGEVPAEFYAAVAEILAWVYRVNRYRYYTEQNQTPYAEINVRNKVTSFAG